MRRSARLRLTRRLASSSPPSHHPHPQQTTNQSTPRPQLQLPRRRGGALRREGGLPRPLRAGAGRVAQVQAAGRPRRPPRLLRRPPLRHGAGRQGRRGDGLRQAAGAARQVHEVLGRLHDQVRPGQARCVWAGVRACGSDNKQTMRRSIESIFVFSTNGTTHPTHIHTLQSTWTTRCATC